LKVEWPEAKIGASDKLTLVNSIMEFNSMVWKDKKERGISLRDGIEGIEIPKGFADFEKDLKACHGI